VVQIDVRGEQLGRRSKVDFGFVGDTKTTLRALLPSLQQNQNEAHLKESLDHYRKTRQDLDKLASGDSGRTPIHPQYVASSLINLHPTMRSSHSMSERRWSGLRAISE
jgi:pyruvate dehydrogenase (quinone)